MKSSYIFFAMVSSVGFAIAQPITCSTAAANTLVPAEGLTERIGDIVYTCTGTPGLAQSVNLTVQLSAAVTNRLSSGTTVTGTVLTVDNGSGPQPVLVQPTLLTAVTLFWQEVPLTFSTQGTLTIRLAGVRTNATAMSVITALLGGSISIFPSTLAVAEPELSLYAGNTDYVVCAQCGSPVPANPDSFQHLLHDGTAFASTRITEGFASAFAPKSAPASLNADTGTRFLIQYSGYPAGSQLFVPSVVAGSDAVQPTAGGDMGVPASGGAYAPSTNGSLLLALVVGADSMGAGGTPGYVPGAIGSGTVKFDAMTQLQLVNGAAYAVYEVIDSNPSTLETAQFPTFFGLTANTVQNPVTTGETVTYAPVSTVAVATATDPIPRFVAETPPNDCGVLGDCGASYFPQLTVGVSSLQYSLPAGSAAQTQYIAITNSGGSLLYWNASVTYGSGSGWLTVQTPSGINSQHVGIVATPGSLPVGTYQATVTIDGGTAGKRFVLVTLVVTPAVTTIPAPQVQTVENSASFAQVPVVPGSLTTIMGTGFSGQNVSATFDLLPATILFSNSTQINLLVPAALSSYSLAQLVVTVDGQSSNGTTVQVASFEPGIFPGAVFNSDSTANSISNPAAGGSEIFFYATGLSGAGAISVRVGTTELTSLDYAGPAPGYPGVQQINFHVPTGLGAVTTELYACGTSAGTEVCSLPVPLTLQ